MDVMFNLSTLPASLATSRFVVAIQTGKSISKVSELLYKLRRVPSCFISRHFKAKVPPGPILSDISQYPHNINMCTALYSLVLPNSLF